MSDLALGCDPALDELDRTHPAVPPPSRPDRSERDLPIQQPDPTTLKAKVTVAENICADTRMKIQEVLQQMEMDPERQTRYSMELHRLQGLLETYQQDLHQDPAFGQVFASSGYRVDEVTVAGGHFGSTLDWGLVEVLPGRIGINKVTFAAFKSLTQRAMADKVVAPPDRQDSTAIPSVHYPAHDVTKQDDSRDRRSA